MEDNLHFLANRRWLQLFVNGRQPHIFVRKFKNNINLMKCSLSKPQPELSLAQLGPSLFDNKTRRFLFFFAKLQTLECKNGSIKLITVYMQRHKSKVDRICGWKTFISFMLVFISLSTNIQLVMIFHLHKPWGRSKILNAWSANHNPHNTILWYKFNTSLVLIKQLLNV